MSPPRALAVFGAAVVADVVWAFYTLTVNRHRPWGASLAAVGIILLGAVGVTAYVDDPVYLIPASVGAFVGTFSTVLYAARKART